MSVLTGPEIVRIVEDHRARCIRGDMPRIVITPYNPSCIGPNSYDVHLASKLKTYISRELDMRQDNPTVEWEIPENGMILYPGELYLGRTVERTVCSGLVPWLDGRSSVGRLGIKIHVTAGRGDDGFGEALLASGGCTWTLEIEVTKPVRVYPGVKIGQLTFLTIEGERKPYTGRYAEQVEPTASKFFANP